MFGLSKFLYTRPRLEQVFSALDKTRLKLPEISLRVLFDDFDQHRVTLQELPLGPWSSPIADVVILAKIALCRKPHRVLEVGSYRGHTTKVLAEHLSANASIVAFDRDPRHGEAYRDLAIAKKIERRIGCVSEDAFKMDPPKSYDLIFLDADHTYEAVKNDTGVLMPLLAPEGVFVWHDYANWGRFSGKNGVPEALHELAECLPLAAVGGSWLAMHMPDWTSRAGSARFSLATQAAREFAPGDSVWNGGQIR